MAVPANPKIYHITHLKNLPEIIKSGVLWSDRKRIDLHLDCEVVGMSRIKERRLNQIHVSCQLPNTVGEYVPFYFCPRSVMLYILYRGNNPDLNYTEGQGPIIHLEADLKATVRWADQHGIQWAFSDRNAGAFMADFYDKEADLEHVNWQAVASNSFSDPVIKDGKQAEFLVFESFPWGLIERIGVINGPMAGHVLARLADSDHKPAVEIRRMWYY